MRRLACALLLASLWVAGGHPAVAQEAAVFIDVLTSTAAVSTAGGPVTHTVVAVLPPDAPTAITSIQSELYGNVADATNPLLAGTTCAVPSVHEPGEHFGAYSWACEFEVWVAGDPGERVDTITMRIGLVDGTELVRSATSTVAVTAELGAIRGTLTDAATGSPIAGAAVMASGPTDSIASTNHDGSFSIEALQPGDYRLLSGNTVTWSSDYAREWWDDAADSGSAGVITVVAGQVTTIEWSLSLGGIIEGTVTDAATGAPIEKASIVILTVHANGSREGPNGGHWTMADGTYQIRGLHSAGYILCFSAQGYEPECWDDVRTSSGSGIYGIDGDLVAVEVGTVVSRIDAALTSLDPEPVTTTTVDPGTGTASTTTSLPAPTRTGATTGSTLPFTGPVGDSGSTAVAGLAALLIGLAALAVTTRHRRTRGSRPTSRS